MLRRLVERIAKDRDLGPTLRFENRHDVEAAQRRAEVFDREIFLGGARDAALLLERHGLGGRAEARAAAALDLDEAEDAVLLGDEIDLAGAGAEVVLPNRVALAPQVLRGEGLPALACAALAAVGLCAARAEGFENSLDEDSRGQGVSRGERGL
jgi:hypothetical protein